jgi:repressor LexA
VEINLVRASESSLQLAGSMRGRPSEKQGQYLAFIYYYTKIHREAPSEAEMQCYFGVTPPAVHQMVLSLARNGFIERTPGKPRSIKLLLPRRELPDLE